MEQLNGALENEFLDVAIQKKLFSNRSNLKFYLSYLFKNIRLLHSAVLDVGGGSGLLSFYAAVKGAKKVVCLEPESVGSRHGMMDTFNTVKSALSRHLPVKQLPVSLQTFKEQATDQFDVVMMHNSVNHLDEQACINLLHDKNSYAIYKNLIRGVYKILKPGGHLIVTDCSCSNFFNSIGLKCPFAPTIEWHKHQKPETWTKLFRTIGFKNAKITWKTPNSFGPLGRVFLANPFGAYFTYSAFKIIVQK